LSLAAGRVLGCENNLSTLLLADARNLRQDLFFLDDVASGIADR